MKTNPLVSIVLPVYNGAQYLAESIDSCIAQTYKNWELIIINDCSKDNSLDIAEKYAAIDTRIRVLSNEVNLKLPASLNKGFREAKGDHYTWTSHDNIMHSEMLEKFVNYLQTNLDVGLVTANYIAIDPQNKELYTVSHPDPMLFMPIGNTVCYAFLYRREVAEKVGEYDTNLFLIEDYDYWIRIWLNYKIGKIYEGLYYTRVHDETLTMQRKEEIAKRLYEIRLNYFEPFNKTLQKHPALQFKFFVSIIDSAKDNKKRLLCRFIKISPISFGLKYLFIYRPKKKIKHSYLYKKIKKH